MIKIFCIIFFPLLLQSYSLKEYVYLAISQSNDSFDTEDSMLISKMSVESAENYYKIKFTPNSSASSSNTQNTLSIGLNGEQRFTTGTSLYAGSSLSKNEYKDSQDMYSLNSKIGIKQSLFRKYGKKYNTISLYRTKENYRLEELKSKKSIQEIIIKAAGYYYDIQLLKEKEVIYEGSLNRSLKNFEIAQKKQEIGLVPKTDVFRAKLTYLGQKQQSIIAKEELDLSKRNFNTYANLSQDEPILLDKSIYVLNWKPFKIDFQNVLSENYSWQKIVLDEAILDRRLYNAKRDLLPDLTLDINYNLSSSQSNISGLTNDMKDSFLISLSSDFSFDNLDKEQNLKKIILEKKRLLREKRTLKQNIKNRLEQYKTRYNSLKYQLDIAEIKQENAKHSQKIANVRYKRGLASNLDITDAELAFSNANIEYYTTIVNFNLNVLNFAKELNILDENFIKKVLKR